MDSFLSGSLAKKTERPKVGFVVRPKISQNQTSESRKKERETSLVSAYNTKNFKNKI
jgi:hypothetical protein